MKHKLSLKSSQEAMDAIIHVVATNAAKARASRSESDRDWVLPQISLLSASGDHGKRFAEAIRADMEKAFTAEAA